jgi:hypothetical protein
LADNAETLATVLTGGKGLAVARVAAKLPKVGPLAGVAAVPALAAAVKLAGAQLKQINEQAKEKHDYLTATLTQFKLDLDQGEADRLLFRSK